MYYIIYHIINNYKYDNNNIILIRGEFVDLTAKFQPLNQSLFFFSEVQNQGISISHPDLYSVVVCHISNLDIHI